MFIFDYVLDTVYMELQVLVIKYFTFDRMIWINKQFLFFP